MCLVPDDPRKRTLRIDTQHHADSQYGMHICIFNPVPYAWQQPDLYSANLLLLLSSLLHLPRAGRSHWPQKQLAARL